MKIIVFSNNTNPDIFIENLSKQKIHADKFNGPSNIDAIDLANSIIIIDIDSLRDQGFTIASKLANKALGKIIVLAVTTLEVDSRASKFDLFFSSFTEVFDKLKEIKKRYDKTLQSDQIKSL
ncbi:MAG: hypothetical protein AB8G05_14690 [Oligoflexales bacterium]